MTIYEACKSAVHDGIRNGYCQQFRLHCERSTDAVGGYLTTRLARQRCLHLFCARDPRLQSRHVGPALPAVDQRCC